MPAYKDEETGKWYCKFYYTDYTGKKKQKKKRGFELKRDAQEWERDFLAKQAAEPTMKFYTLADLYLEDKKAHTKQITYLTKKNRLDTWITPYFKDQALDEITATDVRKWQADLKESKSQKGEPLAPGYLQNLFTELSSVFNFAVRFYGLSVNPCQIAGNTMGKKKKSLTFWVKDEFDRFIATFDKTDPFYTAFLILYYGGLRIGELQALTVGDIDQEAGAITINKTLHLIGGKNVITSPKTEKANRTILIPAFLLDIINRHISRIYDPQDDSRLFLMTASNYAKRLSVHAEMAGVKRIRIHDLRHSNASLLIEMGFSALLVSERLGHENVSTTLNIYSHLFPSKQSEVVDRLEKLCEGNDY
ncbi:MAG: site-specific integrase [Clostridiales bacterium]|nr:site-specific integrase [Clostridiales bacterium]